MTGLLTGFVLIFLAFVVLLMVWSRMSRRFGGDFGPTELSDGSMTIEPTGYPDGMHGHAKKISPTDNNAANM
ncbi:MAG TPA: hypothetical protein VKL19_05300 [Thermoanaerobaculia bacterium]|nr:hypothetical protein [Thermoanaerobaculia bacterium]